MPTSEVVHQIVQGHHVSVFSIFFEKALARRAMPRMLMGIVRF